MKIGIDARWIFKELSGIGVYTRELIRALAQIDSENHYVLFFDSEDLMRRTLSETGVADAGNFTARILSFGLFSAANQWRMPRVMREHRLCVFHSTNYMIPLPAFPSGRPGRIRCVTTVHDLIPLMHPEYAPLSRKSRFFPVYRTIMRQVAKRSDVIITDSESSRRDVLRHMNIPSGRETGVIAIPVGVSSVFKPAPPGTPERSHAGKTVLWVGRPDPYKNLLGLLEAFAMARKHRSFPIQLRLVGPRDERYPEAFQAASRLGIRDDIAWTGYIPEEQLVREYQQADLLILPSRYEGFGLPVVEAMACGTPVICSNKGSLPEVAGDAAIKVQPDDIVGIAEAMTRVLSDSRMAADMIRRGLRHSSRYTWHATARETIRAYRKAIE